MLRTCFSYYFGHFFVFPFLLKHFHIFLYVHFYTHMLWPNVSCVERQDRYVSEYTCITAYAFMFMCVWACVCVCWHVYVGVHAGTCVHGCMSVRVWICACGFVHGLYVCICENSKYSSWNFPVHFHKLTLTHSHYDLSSPFHLRGMGRVVTGQV